MDKYVLLVEIKNSSTEESTEKVQIFDTFDDAKNAMRKAIKNITLKCKFFPRLKGGKYEPAEICAEQGEDKSFALLAQIIRNTISDPEYSHKDVKTLNIEEFLNCDWWTGYIVLVANTELILVDFFGKTLKMNIHNMNNVKKTYFFFYNEVDENNDPVASISVRLLKAKHN